MLSLPEKILLTLVIAASLVTAGWVIRRLVRIIGRGQGRPEWRRAWKGLLRGRFLKLLYLQPTWKARFWTSLFHAGVAAGFLVYLWVNLFDVIHGYDGAFQIHGLAGDIFRLLTDLATFCVLGGMIYLMVRRWVFRPANLTARDSVLLLPQARAGIRRDSAIVAALIVVHVAARLCAGAIALAAQSGAGPVSFDPWQPLTSSLARLWAGWQVSATGRLALEHLFFWISIAVILAFIPYFLYSKHVHLIFAPLNFLLKPERRYRGELERIDFDDENISQFGAARLEDLGWGQLMDAYACVMCFRCQEVCPAYTTGKVLSPAALEINKRYALNAQGVDLSQGKASLQKLVELAITPEAVWACTACGACEEVCPVGAEPMHDILEIRRSLTLMEDRYPQKLQQAYRGMERLSNPWGIPAGERMRWADGLAVRGIEEHPHPQVLWWVGCAPAFDTEAQKSARAFAQILTAAGVDYAVLGNLERCSGDLARRSGREDLFSQLAGENIANINQVNPGRIVTTCPHCLQTLENDYRDYGANYEVVHHTQMIQELLDSGRLHLIAPGQGQAESVAYHDPCYLSRYNDVLAEPRAILGQLGGEYRELARHGKRSACCGAGGAQIWIDEEEGNERMNTARFREAQQTGAATLATGCPFCQTMLRDAAQAGSSGMQVRDIAELVAGRLDGQTLQADEKGRAGRQESQ